MKITEEFIYRKINEVFNNEYLLKTSYTNSRTKIMFYHINCDSSFETTIYNFLYKKQCPVCAKRERIKNSEAAFLINLKKRLFNLVKDEYELLNEPKNRKDKLHLKHNICGHSWFITASNFINMYHRCPKCAEKIRGLKHRKTHERYVSQLNKKYPNQYEVLSKYEKATVRIEIKHIPCGSIFWINPFSLLYNAKCPICKFKKDPRIKPHEQFLAEIGEFIKKEYEILEEYVTKRTKILVKHIPCGHTWKILPSNLLRGRGCPKCAEKIRAQKHTKSPEIFAKKMKDLVGEEYEIMVPYKNSKTHITLKHLFCNHIWDIKPYDFLKGNRCPKCRESKGEKRISNWLKKNNIIHQSQKIFKDCKDQKYLPFDFYLPDYNCCIEYDGRQHFECVDFSGHKNYIQLHEDLKNRKMKDDIKTKYCLNNNIKLIRIPYWENKNIEMLLRSNIFNNSKTS